MIDATKFAAPQIDKDGKGMFQFGTHPDNVTASILALRKMADMVEQGKILLQSIQSGQRLDIDNFLIHGLYIEFVERCEDRPGFKRIERVIDRPTS